MIFEGMMKLNVEKDKNQKVVEGNKVLMNKPNNIKCLVGDFFYFGSYESIEHVIKEIKNLSAMILMAIVK